MRSGNLPARYEVNTICPKSEATKSFTNSATTIYVDKPPYGFPDTGTLRVRQTTSAIDANTEYVNYTGTTKFQQDIINVVAANDSIEVGSTTGLQGNGVQTITFDRPFSNIVAGKTYYVAQVLSSTAFTITDTAGSSLAISLVDAVGSALSPLGIALSGAFTGLTREQSGATGLNTVDLTMASGSSSGTVSVATGIQKGQLVVGAGVPDDTFVHSISGTSIQLSRAVTSTNPSNISFAPLGSGSASAFTYSATQPISLELIQATSVPQISHWGSSVIMDGRYDDDRAYVYTVGTKLRRSIGTGNNKTRSILALRLAPSVDNGIIGSFGSRELVNRMQLALRTMDVLSEGQFFVELVLNPIPTSTVNWDPVGGTSLAEFTNMNGQSNIDFIGGEVIYGFYAGGAQDNAVPESYSLSDVKEISNSILGGGTDNYENTSSPNPTGIFPDGPEVVGIRVTNIGSSSAKIDARISWTEAQA